MRIANHPLGSLPPFALVTALALAGACTVQDADDTPMGESLAQDEEADAEPDADADPDPEPQDHASDEEVFDVFVGDMVEVQDGIMLPVPEPGELYAIEVVYGDGVMSSVTLTHDLAGSVRIVHPDDHLLGLPEGTSAACAAKCTDNSYSYAFGNAQPAKWKSRLDWFYRHNNSPVGKAAAIDAFKHAAAGVPNSRNTCSLADQNNATHSYRGETSVVPGISTAGGVIGCTATGLQDGTNVIGWGGLPGSVLAVTCTRAIVDGPTARIVDMDMRYDNAQNWFTGNTPPAGCNGQYSLRGVGTHEFGHAYGLGHTNQCQQVMAPSTAACTAVNRSFGRGDVLGLRSLY